MPRTDGTGAGLWPTAVADDTGLRKKKYSQGGTALSLAVQQPQMWPTPIASEAKTNKDIRPTGKSNSLTAHVGGSLNPNWVEWLMGYEIGFTDLDS
jgi:hypothetical protein